jgi:hypothetical protein
VAKFLHHTELFRPIQLRKKNSGVAIRFLRYFGRPMVFEFALLLAALGTVFVFAYVFLDFRVSKFMNLFGL